MTTRFWDPNSPSLCETIVCYADILGFSARTKRAFALGRAEPFLREIKCTLGMAYDRVRRTQTLSGRIPPLFDMKVFTDNIVLAYPVKELTTELGEHELGTILMLFAEVQASLAAGGFLIRGAIAFGPHYQDQEIAYGSALIEAVGLDKRGGGPRLVISPSAEKLVNLQLTSYGQVSSSPHYQNLLRDPSDGRLFVNYLEVIFENFVEDGIDYDLLKLLRDNVSSALQEHQSDSVVRQKYEWLATYYNYVCSDFAEQWRSILNDPEADADDLAFANDAQHALNCLLPCYGLSAPRRLDE